jgi:PAS domain S-box-containing protein
MSRAKEVLPSPRALPSVALVTSKETHILREAEISFRMLFLNHPEPMWVYDLETLRLLEVNDAAIKHYGYSRDEFLCLPLTDIHDPEDLPVLFEDIARSRAGMTHSGECRHLLKDGRLIDVEVICHGVAFGEPEKRLVVVRDITKQKQAEQALRQAERKYRLIFEEAIVGMYQSTLDGCLLSANPAMARMFGFDSPGELIACVSDDSQLYADPARWQELKRLLREQGVVKHFELHVGKEIPWSVTREPSKT